MSILSPDAPEPVVEVPTGNRACYWALDPDADIGTSRSGVRLKLSPFLGVMGMPLDLPGPQSTFPPPAVTGGTVSLAPEARIAGRVWLAGAEVDVQGRVDGSVRAAGRTVRIGGTVDGDVDLAAAEIEILPTAQVRGALVYRSPRAAIVAPGAQIAGGIRHVPADWPAPGRAVRVIGLVIAVAGIAWALLLPSLAASSARTISGAPWTSLAVGFAVLVATPVAVAILVATLLRAPLGIALAALYVVTLIVGLLIGVT